MTFFVLGRGGGDGDRDSCSDSELSDSKSVDDTFDLSSEDICRIIYGLGRRTKLAAPKMFMFM